MKIAQKILLFILFLLAVLAVNTLVGLEQLAKFHRDMRLVVSQDLKLNETLMAIGRSQLTRSVLFERLLAITEELAFVDLSAQRQDYLSGQIQSIHDDLIRLNETTTKNITATRSVIADGIKTTKVQNRKKELDYLNKILAGIETQQQEYHAILIQSIATVRQNQWQTAIETLTNIRHNAMALNQELERLASEIQTFAANSLDRSQYDEFVARNILWASFWFSLLIIALISFTAIYSIAAPLRELIAAARLIERDKFPEPFQKFHNDEIGEIARAFNALVEKLRALHGMLDKKQVELELHTGKADQQRTDLEKSNAELDLFVQTISHDIRAPLTAITGYIDHLKKHAYEKSDAQAKRSIDGILSSTKHMHQLIDDLLQLTQMSRIQNPYESVNIAEIIDSVRDRLKYAIDRFHAELKVASDLPTLRCDKIKIREAFFNLIDNAIKFSSTGKQPPKVEISFKEYPSYYEFYVKDNGIGVAEEYHDEIFKLFKRAHTDERFEGTGAGLSIVKAIIEGHGGRVWVQSQPGFGSTFHFTIPKN